MSLATTLPDATTCFLVRDNDAGGVTAGIERLPVSELPDGDVLIRVAYSSVNYKDGLASRGHKGVIRRLPHVPGIDAAGTVVESRSPQVATGAEVIVTGYELGAGRWGGWSEFIRVPAEWVVPLPTRLSLREAMILGTAGFTAAQCVQALELHRIEPGRGPVLVTGATGGVGCLAVMLLARLGYSVSAVSGKPEREEWLKSLGAKEVLPREAVVDTDPRPLLSTRWAGAVDTVGGATLGTIVRSLQHRGCVAACGLVGGDQLPLSVYPFLLRGVKLDGIDSAMCPYPDRVAIWRRLSREWRLDRLDEIAHEVPLAGVGDAVETILAGKVAGRTVVKVG
jgi:acrylyl-CoA reductase (NADPH)